MAWMYEPNIACVMMWVYIYDNAHIRIDELEKPLYPGVYCWIQAALACNGNNLRLNAIKLDSKFQIFIFASSFYPKKSQN